MLFPRKDEVLEIHRKLLEQFGGLGGMRGEGSKDAAPYDPGKLAGLAEVRSPADRPNNKFGEYTAISIGHRMDRYDPARNVTAAFLDRVAGWIQQSGEVLVILRYLRAAGAKDFALCRTRGEFEGLVESLPTGTDIEVFRNPQLPVRDTVNEAFIASAHNTIPDGQEYLVVTREVLPGGRIIRFGDIGCSHADLRESLEELMGTDVALGLCPGFCVPDHEGLVSAAKGGIDGPR